MEKANVKEEVWRLVKFIKEDNVDEVSKILNSNDNLRSKFNSLYYFSNIPERGLYGEFPLLHIVVQAKSQKVAEYLLSQDFVDKTIRNFDNENIYHVICRIRGAEELFSIIERKVPHHLLLNNSYVGRNPLNIACERNNIFIVKRVHEILQSLQVDLTPFKRKLGFVLENDDIEVIKYVLSIDGIQLNDSTLYRAIGNFKFDIVVYLLNSYLCRSIPSHVHNQFHILQFLNNHKQSEEEKKEDFNQNFLQNRDDHNVNIYQHNCENNNNENNNDNYLKITEENYKNIVEKEYYGNRIWHGVCRNANLDVVQLIFSLKGFQPEILSTNGFNLFLIACDYNSNIKVIKYIHKLVPSFINSQLILSGSAQNGAHLLIYNTNFKERLEKLNILHYLYLNGIDIHLISNDNGYSVCESIYTKSKEEDFYDPNIAQYLKVISQDFDYLHNEHDDKDYRKPSFWKQFHNNNNNIAYEQSKAINEWKNRFEEHVLHHLSKMIQQHMLLPNETL